MWKRRLSTMPKQTNHYTTIVGTRNHLPCWIAWSTHNIAHTTDNIHHGALSDQTDFAVWDGVRTMLFQNMTSWLVHVACLLPFWPIKGKSFLCSTTPFTGTYYCYTQKLAPLSLACYSKVCFLHHRSLIKNRVSFYN